MMSPQKLNLTTNAKRIMQTTLALIKQPSINKFGETLMRYFKLPSYLSSEMNFIYEYNYLIGNRDNVEEWVLPKVYLSRVRVYGDIESEWFYDDCVDGVGEESGDSCACVDGIIWDEHGDEYRACSEDELEDVFGGGMGDCECNEWEELELEQYYHPIIEETIYSTTNPIELGCVEEYNLHHYIMCLEGPEYGLAEIIYSEEVGESDRDFEYAYDKKYEFDSYNDVYVDEYHPNDLIFDINQMFPDKNKKLNEHQKIINEGFFDILSNLFKKPEQKSDTPDELNQYLQQLQDTLDENEIYDEEVSKLVDQLKDSDYIDLIDFPTMLRGLENKLLKSGDKTEIVIDYLSRLNTSLPKRAKYEKKLLQGETPQGVDYYDEVEEEKSKIPRKIFKTEKELLQIELLKLQEWVKKNNIPLVIIFEGRDTAGKGSTIGKMTEYLDPKYFNVIALGIPTDEEKKNWFQRYEKYIEPGKITFFDRSWYNRGIVEPVMGYSSKEEYEEFMRDVVPFEKSLLGKGVILIKFWLSITQGKQEQRFTIRQQSPLKYWKYSPNDEASREKWDEYTDYKERVFKDTSHSGAPWVILDSNDKRMSALNAMRHVLDQVDYDDKNSEIVKSKYPEAVTTIRRKLNEEQLSLYPWGVWNFPTGTSDEEKDVITTTFPESLVKKIFEYWDKDPKNNINRNMLKLVGAPKHISYFIPLLVRYLQNTKKPLPVTKFFDCDDLQKLFVKDDRQLVDKYLCSEDFFGDDLYGFDELHSNFLDDLDDASWDLIIKVLDVDKETAERLLYNKPLNEEEEELIYKYEEDIDNIKHYISWANSDAAHDKFYSDITKDIKNNIEEHFDYDGKLEYRNGKLYYVIEDDLKNWVQDDDAWDNINRFEYHPDYADHHLEDILYDFDTENLNNIFNIFMEEEYSFDDCYGKKGDCLELNDYSYYYPDYDINPWFKDRMGDEYYQKLTNEKDKETINESDTDFMYDNDINMNTVSEEIVDIQKDFILKKYFIESIEKLKENEIEKVNGDVVENRKFIFEYLDKLNNIKKINRENFSHFLISGKDWVDKFSVVTSSNLDSINENSNKVRDIIYNETNTKLNNNSFLDKKRNLLSEAERVVKLWQINSSNR